MAVPSDAKIFAESIDPYDIVDYEIDLAPLLEVGEDVASHTLTIPTESALLGLEIKTTGGYTTNLNANILRFWLGINAIEQGNAAFVNGVILPIEVSITTNSTPLRRKKRTVALKVIRR